MVWLYFQRKKQAEVELRKRKKSVWEKELQTREKESQNKWLYFLNNIGAAIFSQLLCLVLNGDWLLFSLEWSEHQQQEAKLSNTPAHNWIGFWAVMSQKNYGRTLSLSSWKPGSQWHGEHGRWRLVRAAHVLFYFLQKGWCTVSDLAALVEKTLSGNCIQQTPRPHRVETAQRPVLRKSLGALKRK